MQNFNSSNYFSKLAEKASKTMKKEEVQALKSKLVKGGAAATIVGVIACFAGFFSFATYTFNAVGNYGIEIGDILFRMFIFMAGGIISSLGILALKAGLAMVITEKTVDFLDENAYCPKCNSLLEKDEKFCDNCGENILAKKTCDCGKVNGLDSKFCKECGKEL